MKSTLLIAILLITAFIIKAQAIDSICFHLYTDSLKKGTYNYINVDGKLSNGRWLPLTAKEINFSASAGNFDGNSLFIAKDFTGEKITVRAVLKQDSSMSKETCIYIKRKEDNEKLKTVDEVIQSPARSKKQKKNNNPGL